VTRRRRWAVAATGAVVVLTAAGAAAVTFDRQAGGTPPADVPPATTTVRRQTLATEVSLDGTLGYGDPAPLSSQAGGTVTWLPQAGATVRRGGTLLRADNRRVVLLYGTLPLYRTLQPGTDGPDVAALERNLDALGYDGFTVDDEYTSATASAVRRFQDDLGVPETGRVEASWAVVADGAIRVAELKSRVGAPGTGEVFTYTGTRRQVTLDVAADDAGWAKRGAKVTVALPDGRSSAGTVAAVGTVATGKEGEDATIAVTVALKDQRATGTLDQAPVEVTYVGEQRRNVLAVPVAALLALAEGGYGLEVVEGGRSRYVAVKVGMFADGQVEVSGDGIAEGTTVGVPS
jgi:peptidoglycan hydrolase-like protein with peptidoglycan-binding domain